MRNFSIVNGEPQATVVQRNYDPYAWSPSSNVNDVAYSYTLVYSPGNPPTNVDAVEYPIDPTQSSFPAVADGALKAGSFYSGLTRDDAAGLRYLLHTNNMNLESLLPGVHGAGTNAGSYVNSALRGGVNKIVLVRPDYDTLTGQFFVSYTNQFVDTYIANAAIHQQQLERVITQPDILFSSADLSGGTRPTARFVRTGTTNWLSSSGPGGAGPGVIRPKVQIALQRPDFSLWTADSLADTTVITQDLQDYRWGSFDISTNPPVTYPVGSTPPATNQLTVRLELDFGNLASPPIFTWQLPVALGSQARLQTSTKLNDWVPVLAFVNHGQPLIWHHTASQPQRYFRVVSQ